jgi:hypothetical protein
LAGRHAAQDRAELGRSRSGRASEPHAAQAERRILLMRDRQIGHRLVAADIERADDQRRPARASAIAA